MYAAGNNPVNDFTNRPIVGREDFEIGGWASHSDMIGYTLDQFGPLGQGINYALSPLMGESYETGAETCGQEDAPTTEMMQFLIGRFHERHATLVRNIIACKRKRPETVGFFPQRIGRHMPIPNFSTKEFIYLCGQR